VHHAPPRLLAAVLALGVTLGLGGTASTAVAAQILPPGRGEWSGELGGDLTPARLFELPRHAAAGALGVVGAPFVRYSPETAWGFGAAGMIWFHADPVARAAGRASTVGLAFQQTTRHQTVGALQWDAYLAEGTWRSAGNFFVERWPYDFWGVGADAGGLPERYAQRTTKLDTGLTHRVLEAGPGRGLWLGGRAQWRRDAIADATPGGRVAGCTVDGCRGGQVAALQAVAAWDTRDRVCATEDGLLLAARGGAARGFGSTLGSDAGYRELELDARGWRRLPWLRAVVSGQARLHATDGLVPFYLLPTFGGDRSLRGVVEGRFRDQTSFLVQGELAVPLGWRLGLELFAGAGEAAPRPGALSLRALVPAGGAGLRFTVDPVERVFVRIDHGVSPGSSQWYLSIGSAI